MALKWIEGFETHTSVTTLQAKWLSAAGSIGLSAGRTLGNSATGTLQMVTPSLGLDDTMIAGFGMRVNSNCVFSGENGVYFQRGSQEQCHLFIDFQSGVGFDLVLKRGATEIDRTTVTLDFDIWHYVEMKADCLASGDYEVRVNGVTVFSGTGAQLNESGLTGADTFALFYPGTFLSTRFFMDDIYVLDGSGATANDFLGPQAVEGIQVTANGSVNDWTNDGGGDNYTSVDDAPNSPDDSGVGGTLSSGTTGQEDLFTMSDLASLTGTITGIQVNMRAATDVAGTRDVLFKVKTGANASASGGTKPVSDTVYKNIHQIMETNPSTAAGWTIADVNNTELGMETGS